MAPLQELQSFLATQYKSKLDLDVVEVSRNEIPKGDRPSWQWQSKELKPAENSNASGALFLDGDIGLCLFVQSFDEKTDVRLQLARALQMRSALRPRRQTSLSQIDNLGEWSVSVLWLMQPEKFDGWIAEVADVRQQTSHFEEVSIDALVNHGNDWPASCRLHGLPRLLLDSRAALRHKNPEATTDWIGADAVIVEKLKKIAAELPSSLARYSADLNHAIQRGINAAPQRKLTGVLDAPLELQSVAVRNFRNVSDLFLDLRDSTERIGVNIIQGPNGTGKSSISEAMAIALSGVSNRYLDYLNDSNEPGPNKAQKYVQKYLTPLNRDEEVPEVGVNGPPKPVSLLDGDDAVNRCSLLSGTFLSQSWSENLLRIRASDLGAEIAGSYTSIVGDVIDFVERRQLEAEGERTAFNREWGIRANVSRDETAKLRIAANVLGTILPVPRSTLMWLKTGAELDWRFRDGFDTCARRWEAWEVGSSDRERDIAVSEKEIELRGALNNQLETYNLVSRLASELVASVQDARKAANELAPNLRQDIEAWCASLDPRTTPPAPETAVLRQRETGLQSKLEQISKHGKTAAEQLRQIQSVTAFIKSHWNQEHPDLCPICLTDLQDRNGVLSAVAATESHVEAEVQIARAEYIRIKRELDEAVVELRKVDSASRPLQGEALSRVRHALDIVMGGEGTFDRLNETHIRSNVFKALEFLQNSSLAAPPVMNDEELERRAAQSARKLWEAFSKFGQVSETPEAWKAVLARIYGDLTATIREHLPATVQAVWLELARNIMPAPWQYPGRVEFQVDHKRAQAEAKVIVRGASFSPLAAHILNGAELHNLGIAWFFTRYLTSGRFVHRFMVLDDPAQQMDQPTFRDFCRLVATLIRLHAIYDMPLTLVLFLHQDERALDAARATNGTLHLLRWHSGNAAIETRVKMRISPVAPLTPYGILQAG